MLKKLLGTNISVNDIIMEELAIVKVSQKFLLFCACSSKEYSITLKGLSLNLDNEYFVHYIFPNKARKEAKAEAVTDHELLVKESPEFDYPCTVHVEMFTNSSEQCIAKFSLDLVSPVEYLFRSLSLDDKSVSSRMSHKMTSALLAMSLSYYYVMGADVEMEQNADEILCTLLGNNSHNTRGQRIGNSSNIIQFAQRYHLQNTLHCLSADSSAEVDDISNQSPKMLPEHKESIDGKVLPKPRVLPRTFQNTHQQSVYTPLTGSFKTESEYTPLTRDEPHDEPKKRMYSLPRDQSYEEITEGKYDQEYEEIQDVHPYEDAQPYEEPASLKKEKPYDEPDITLDHPLESPIYIVPDPEEQKKLDYPDHHFNAKNTNMNGDHNTFEKASGKQLVVRSTTIPTHRRSKSMEFLDYNETQSSRPVRPPPPNFNKKGLNSDLPPVTKYNTLSRLQKRNVTQSLSAVKPFKSDKIHPQPNEKPFAKKDSIPSPKPRSVTKIFT